MILRPRPGARTAPEAARPAWQVFQETQSAGGESEAVVLQAEHAKLAGELAAHLVVEVFGELPAEVIEAIGLHDSGWRESDEAQLASPKSFLAVSPEVSAACWTRSVRNAERISPLAGVLTARHFRAVAQDVPAHQAFVAAETLRMEATERQLGIPREALARWTAALGFCDLLSLYLCCGTRQAAVFPLAHPALAEARDAPAAMLEWYEGRPCFRGQVMNRGAVVSVEAVQWAGARRAKVEWEFGAS